MARLLDLYRNQIRVELAKKYSLKNIHQAPKLEKVMINMCCPDGAKDFAVLEQVMGDMAVISGQKPKITRAKKSIANFKLRENTPIGCMVTLRGSRMYEFVDRFTTAILPRLRDFRGINPRSFDKQGNYSLGLTEQVVFPEINLDKMKRVQGMDITFVVQNGNPEKSKSLLQYLGLPFKI